jgi:D-alanine-D-alanine ligase-like ATP-grasp enzyme
MNIYAQILIDEAQKRGIDIEILDEHANLFALRYKGQTVMCRESLTEKTSAIAMAICADKSLTHRWLRRAGIAVPHHEKIKMRAESLQALQETSCHPATECANQELEEWQKAVRFMRKWKRIVVKPAHGEQGKGVTVDISDEETLKAAIKRAQQFDDELIIEQFIQGKDVRIVVINYQFVAAIERIPASIQGDGTHT